jgi:hypothetical protein
LFPLGNRTTRCGGHRRTISGRLALESLEDRLTPSSNLQSGGTVTLPFASTVNESTAVAGGRTLLQFNDSSGTTADYNVTITWGDGASDTFDSATSGHPAVVSGQGGVFTVVSTAVAANAHVYQEEVPAGTNFTIQVKDKGSSASTGPVSAPFTATDFVADQQITGLTVTPPPGVGENQSTPANFNVAHFTDPAGQGLETAADFAATVDFGDGSGAVASTVVHDSGGNYHVEIPSHKYGDESTHVITVTVTHDLLSPVSASAAIVIADTPVVVTSGPPISAVEAGSTNFVQVASFTDPGDVDSVLDNAATVNWGDGSKPDSTTDVNARVFITQVGPNKFIVQGTHVYAEEAPAGGFTVTTTVTHGASHVALVGDGGNDVAETIDVNSNAVLGTVSLPPSGTPPVVINTAISADGTLGFATNFSSNLSVINLSNPSAPTVVNTIPISNVGEDLSLTPDGKFVVVVGNDSTISVVSVASRTEVHTFNLASGVPAQSVDASVPGIVLVTSDGNGTVNERNIDGSGNLTSTGTTLSFTDPLNVVVAPGGTAGVVLSHSTGALESFTVPSLTAVNSRTLANNNGLSAVFNPAGTVVYARSTVTPGNTSNSVDAFGFNATTGTLSAAPLFSISVAAAFSFYGIDPLAISPDGTRLFVPNGTTHAIDVFDASTGASLGSIPAGSGSVPEGIAIGTNPGVASTATTTAKVTDPSVSATGGFTVTATEGKSFTGQTVATFTDPTVTELTGGQPTPGEYGASITWGDGTGADTNATITFNPATNTFTVQGSHSYAEEGNYDVIVTLTHGTAPNATAISSSAVIDPSVVLNTTPLTFTAVEGQTSATQMVATFTDPGGAEATSEYTATINWGDGSSTPGTITFGNGTFSVSGSHTYAQASSPGSPNQVKVTVSHGTATAVSATTALATVAEAPTPTPTPTPTPPTPTPRTYLNPFTGDRTTADAGLTPQQRVIQALYLDDLGRAGSVVELNAYLPLLNGPNGQLAVARAIEGSAEGRDNLVKGWYQTFLGRAASGGEEQPHVNALLAGQSEEQVLSGILGGQEFFNRAQTLINSGSPQERFVQALYQLLLGRAADATGLSVFLSLLQSGGSRAGVALAILQSQEFRTDLVVEYYSTLLHRSPTAQEAMSNVPAFVSSGLDALSLRLAFESSPEFFANG